MGEYHEDETLNWLASQFAEGLVNPSEQARKAYDEITRLREVRRPHDVSLECCMCQEAIDAIKALDVAGAPSFITCESSPVDPPKVVAKFTTIEQAQAFHQALIQCGEAAGHMDAAEQADSSRPRC